MRGGDLINSMFKAKNPKAVKKMAVKKPGGMKVMGKNKKPFTKGAMKAGY